MGRCHWKKYAPTYFPCYVIAHSRINCFADTCAVKLKLAREGKGGEVESLRFENACFLNIHFFHFFSLCKTIWKIVELIALNLCYDSKKYFESWLVNQFHIILQSHRWTQIFATCINDFTYFNRYFSLYVFEMILLFLPLFEAPQDKKACRVDHVQTSRWAPRMYS